MHRDWSINMIGGLRSLKSLRRYTKSFDKPLEWKEMILEDGTAFYTHPTYEEVMSVKHFRTTQQKITPEDIIQLRELRNKDPWAFTSKRLAKRYSVTSAFINMVAKEPEKKALQDLSRLRQYNEDKPKKSSKQHRNNRKIGKKIHSKK
jgi:hypothetical protein